MKVTLWKVFQQVLGSERGVELYFADKKEADRFYLDSDYADKPIKVKLSSEKANRVLTATDYYFSNN